MFPSSVSLPDTLQSPGALAAVPSPRSGPCVNRDHVRRPEAHGALSGTEDCGVQSPTSAPVPVLLRFAAPARVPAVPKGMPPPSHTSERGSPSPPAPQLQVDVNSCHASSFELDIGGELLRDPSSERRHRVSMEGLDETARAALRKQEERQTLQVFSLVVGIPTHDLMPQDLQPIPICSLLIFCPPLPSSISSLCGDSPG